MLSEILLPWFHSSRELNVTSGGILAGIFVFTAFVPLPRTVLIVVAGATFGLACLLIIIPCAWIGSLLSFASARYFLRNSFQKFVNDRPLLRAVSVAVDKEGWRVVGLMRLGVPVPSSLQNYIFGVSNVELSAYAAATFFFSIPQIVCFAYVGYSGKAVLSHYWVVEGNEAGMLISLVSALCLACLVGRRARHEMLQITGKVSS